jgi:hypothetical protein
MQLLMAKGNSGHEVDRLAESLTKTLGPDAVGFPVLSKPGSAIDDEFDAAIRRWQAGIGVIADGIVGPRCQVLLGLIPPQGDKLIDTPLDVGNVSRLFPATKPANIARYLPYVEAALGVAGLTDRATVTAALGTIRAETEGFVPISEFQSKFNTPAGGAPFSSYDTRGDLGNHDPGDGERFRGRGFVQLTGKNNYEEYGDRIRFPLLANVESANAPEVAAVVLAVFLLDKADKLRTAVAKGRLDIARRLVNGGVHGLDLFKDVFKLAKAVWPIATPATAARRSAAKTPQRPQRSSHKIARTKKDAVDLRDRLFMPSPTSLPDEFPAAKEVHRFLRGYTKAGLILNQGQEGACTGFGLTCVINYLRWMKSGLPEKFESVSPRMLYTLARRYDEYQGENYEGSSCRGALKGWFNNGVCLESDWPYAPAKSNPAMYGFADRASENTLGVYYRIETKSITDMQAAIAQHRAIFVSAYTHDGWDNVPEIEKLPQKHAGLPLIAFDGKPSQDGGHAFALVGFNSQGFVLQNSWGNDWGAAGFAVLTYLDWLANGMDAWVVSLGVPGVIAGRLVVSKGAVGNRAGADRSKWWDTGLAYQHSIILGNDGRVSRYLTEDEQPRKLQQQAYALPDQWFRQQLSVPKRLVIYAHGGLNSEADAIKRASAMGRFFVGNGCYPLFLVWKTGLLESIGDIISDAFRRQPSIAGAAEWLTEKTDLMVEKAIGRPLARPIWSEMKENAELAFAPRRGGSLLLDAIQALAATWGSQFELHLIGHSAGSIALGHFLSSLAARLQARRDDGLGARVMSIHLYAPACTVSFANRHYASDERIMDRLYLNVLSDKIERGDQVASIYRKSLLYLVSNALETDLRTPILGLDAINDLSYTGWDGSSDTGEALATWRNAAVASKLRNRTRMTDVDRIDVATGADGTKVTQPAGHGGFDNDLAVLSGTLEQIINRDLVLSIDDLRDY